MNRSEEILELIGTKNQFSQSWTNDLLGWLGDREDAELIEIMRGVCATLAYRMVGEQMKPSAEVFFAALDDIATAFKENIQGD
jgi:hypothetical protein